MLHPNTELYCGLFDSSIIRQNFKKSENRRVACYELELFHHEGGVSYLNEERYPTRRGMLLCAKPNQIRHSEFPVRCSFIRITVDENTQSELVAILSSLPNCTYLSDENEIEELMGLFRKLNSCFAGNSAEVAVTVRIQRLFWEILARLLKTAQAEESAVFSTPPSRIVREAYEYINENYTSDCSLETIAQAVNVSPNHLHATFRRCTGMTPYEYTVQKRIEKAKKLIAAEEKSMLEIALELGFCSQSHFNKVFRKQTGLPPAEYRKRLLEQY